ncbi:hypothetical protein [Cupriavidus sp. UYPR2.512]|uniref:hypothetical protein n=1 Tax=Cupriavidus sp. UYPR2.512 TaxID=1080187 RepID=UPI00036B83CB|nr:hypothetical protein [Cupriavidus sp. UYPR2.512]UIF89414.1 hypothetical protein KAF44_29525 [Cupriavidus necator]
MNAINKPIPAGIKSCILVHAVDGRAEHSFMTAEQGHAAFDEIQQANGCGSIFQTDSADDAKLIYDVSPDLRNRVAEAKISVRKHIEWKAALDRHEVPTDPQLRKSIYRALQDILDQTISSAILSNGRSIQ